MSESKAIDEAREALGAIEDDLTARIRRWQEETGLVLTELRLEQLDTTAVGSHPTTIPVVKCSAEVRG